jgi:hypothetical protein
MPYVKFRSHPGLVFKDSGKPFAMTQYAHSEYWFSSYTWTMDASLSPLIMSPYVPIALTSHAYRIIVQLNGAKLAAMNPHAAAHGGPVAQWTDAERTHPQYELRLERGIANRVEVEVICLDPKNQKDLIWEKMMCFVYVPIRGQHD